MLSLLLLAGTLVGPAASLNYMRVACDPSAGDIYQFNSTTFYGNDTISFDQYAGKVVLIYNVATYWGLTTPSYGQINALAEKYAGQDLVILGFPCNQFGKQEPGTPVEIMNGIRYVRPGGGFVPKIHQYFEKSEVNGANEIPLYTYLKGTCGHSFTEFANPKNLFYSPLKVGDIWWNFEKFLIGRDGKPYTRYHPHALKPEDLSPDIDNLLSQPVPQKEQLQQQQESLSIPDKLFDFFA